MDEVQNCILYLVHINIAQTNINMSPLTGCGLLSLTRNQPCYAAYSHECYQPGCFGVTHKKPTLEQHTKHRTVEL